MSTNSKQKTVRVIVALSGGVDSAVAGHFMKSCVHTVADLLALQSTSALHDAHSKIRSVETIAHHIRSRTPWRRVAGDNVESLVPHPVLGDGARCISYLPVFMRNWEGDGDGEARGWCEKSLREFYDATAVAKETGLIGAQETLKEMNFSAEYSLACFDPMLEAFCRGETLNADILCNTEIKFGALWKHCKEMYGAEAMATGHYARSCVLPSGDALLARPRTAGNDLNDQTVFLSRLSPSQIARGVFPLGHLFERKEDVRGVAGLLGLDGVATKKTSTGLCFVSPKLGGSANGCKPNFSAFLDEYTRKNEGSDSLEGSGKGIPATTRFILVDNDCDDATSGPVDVIVKHRYGSQRRLPAYAFTLGEKVQAYVPSASDSKRKKAACATNHSKQALRTLYVSSKILDVEDSCECGTAVVRWLSRVELVSRWDHPSFYTQHIAMQHISFAASIELMVRCGVMRTEHAEGKNAQPQELFKDPSQSGAWYVLACFCSCRHQEPLRAAVAHVFVPSSASESSASCSGWVEVSEPVRAATPGQAVVMYVRESVIASQLVHGTDNTVAPQSSIQVRDDAEDHASFIVVASGWISSHA